MPSAAFSVLPVVFARLFISFFDQSSSGYDYQDYEDVFPLGNNNNNNYYNNGGNNGIRQGPGQSDSFFILKGDNLCVALDEQSTKRGAYFGLYSSCDQGDKRFQFQRVEQPNGYFFIRNVYSGLCIAAPKGQYEAVYQSYCDTYDYKVLFGVDGDASGHTRYISYYGKYLTRGEEGPKSVFAQGLKPFSTGQFW